ncbi:hypothetical protein B0A50_07661 [Salinomyces thailandicus]|uniref:Uncharacterized protein n=1 Tax=Salinomyces thailandicus TaxID=706561 RepID=A0A4U0TLP7_9PEZI|nr:hypothetical protein B0A50_07661 [Salinomyces thailandica]
MSTSDQEYEQKYEAVDKPKRKSAKGRKLVRWNPDLDQLTLLCVDYVCTKEGIAIPWDEIAAEVEPYLTGEAIKQHMVKIYKFREDDGHKVPPKLDRNQRRKAFANSSDVTTSAGKGSKNNSFADDDDDEDLPEEPYKPGRGLLYKGTPAKSKRAPKKAAANSKTPAAGRGRKQAQVQKTPIKTEDTDGEGNPPPKPKNKTASRGVKRGRKSMNGGDDDDEDYDFDTPTKAPKTDSYLRARPAVDYTKQVNPDSKDEDDEYEEAAVKEQHAQQEQSKSGTASTPPKMGSSHGGKRFYEERAATSSGAAMPSQGLPSAATSTREYGAAPPNTSQRSGHIGFQDSRPGSGKQSTITPPMNTSHQRGFLYDDSNSYTSSASASTPNQRVMGPSSGNDHANTPSMSTPKQRAFNNFNSGPPFNFNFNGGMNLGAGGDPFVNSGHAEFNNYMLHTGQAAQHDYITREYHAQNPQYESNKGVKEDSSPYPAMHGHAVPRLFANTSVNSVNPGAPTVSVSPTELERFGATQGTTTITPAMADTGFKALLPSPNERGPPPKYNYSFDSGFNGSEPVRGSEPMNGGNGLPSQGVYGDFNPETEDAMAGFYRELHDGAEDDDVMFNEGGEEFNDMMSW